MDFTTVEIGSALDAIVITADLLVSDSQEAAPTMTTRVRECAGRIIEHAMICSSKDVQGVRTNEYADEGSMIYPLVSPRTIAKLAGKFPTFLI